MRERENRDRVLEFKLLLFRCCVMSQVQKGWGLYDDAPFHILAIPSPLPGHLRRTLTLHLSTISSLVTHSQHNVTHTMLFLNTFKVLGKISRSLPLSLYASQDFFFLSRERNSETQNGTEHSNSQTHYIKRLT